jgi:hypothetical protein
MKCKKCYTVMRPGLVLVNQMVQHGTGPYGRPGATLSRSGPATLCRCLKCPKCGHTVAFLSKNVG